jgi:diguanylate cyclase (GGDEF)-like protein
LSLLVLDLDFLKSVNDRFGHPTGDAVIRSVGETIKVTCREIDFAARYGGEEFVVILPDTDLPGAIEVAERLRKRIHETDVGEVGQITASVGVANYPVNALSGEDLVWVADQALYVAKNGGRNQVAHFTYELTNQ